MTLESKKLYMQKNLGLHIEENRRENGVISIEVNSEMLDDEVLYNEPLNSRTDNILKEIFNGFGIASNL